MPILIYNSTSTFLWPDDVTNVDAFAFGGGAGGRTGSASAGGGGGEGGEYTYTTIYRGTESSLTITVGNGGTASAAGGDSVISQGTYTALRARGGAAPAGTAGGSGNGNGGNGGTSYFGRGGGGGAGGGGNGTDATTPGNPSNHGQGGVPTPGYYFTGGAGGQGGDADSAGSAGVAPGGAGGGGATGKSGGAGAKGRVILIYGSESGSTRFSGGCCCGQCDLTKEQIPETITVNISTTPYTPDGWPASWVSPPYTGTLGIDYYIYLGCNPDIENPTHIFYDEETWDRYVIDNQRSSFLNDKSITLELTNFIADSNLTYYSDGFELPAGRYVRCFWQYECPVADISIDDGAQLGGFGNGGDYHICLLGTSPVPSHDFPTQTACGYDDDDPPSCIESSFYYWHRRGEVRCRCTVELTLYKNITTGKYYWNKYVSFVSQFKYSGGLATDPPQPGYSSDPSLDNWLVGTFMYGEGVLGYATGREAGGPYDTAQDAMEAMRVAVVQYVNNDTNPILLFSQWTLGDEGRVTSGNDSSGLWFVSYSDCEDCGELPNGLAICANNSETWEFEAQGDQLLCDYAYVSFEATW